MVTFRLYIENFWEPRIDFKQILNVDRDYTDYTKLYPPCAFPI